MATLRDLQVWCNIYASEIPIRLNARKQQVTLAMGEQLITDTPVDTTNAESNWQAGLGGPPPGPIPPHYPGEHGSTDAASQNEAKALLRAKILQAQPGEPVYLSNNVPYIIKLDQGWSAQAPLGFTHIALALGRRLLAAMRFRGGRQD